MRFNLTNIQTCGVLMAESAEGYITVLKFENKLLTVTIGDIETEAARNADRFQTSLNLEPNPLAARKRITETFIKTATTILAAYVRVANEYDIKNV
jgi:hypothetical protein